MNIDTLRNALISPANPSKFTIDISVPLALRATSLGNKFIESIPIIGTNITAAPTSVPSENSFKALVKSTSLPEMMMNTVDVWHRGHKVVIRSTNDFTHKWDVTFYNTSTLGLKKFFENWMYEMDRYDSALVSTTFNDTFGVGEISDGYTSSLKVHQLCSDGTIDSSYQFYYAFPVAISAVNLDSSSINTVSEFTVTFAYSYFVPYKESEFDKAFNKIQKTVSKFL